MATISNLRDTKPGIQLSIELATFVFLDIETTGLRPDRGAKITEVSILNRNFHQFVWKSDKNSKKDAFHLQLPEIFECLKCGIVVGHNLSFDFWFLSYEADRYGIGGPKLRFIDTLSLARKLLPEKNSYKLGDLLKEFDIKVAGELHTATTDAEVTRALFWKLIEKGGISTVGKAGMKKMTWSSF